MRHTVALLTFSLLHQWLPAEALCSCLPRTGLEACKIPAKTVHKEKTHNGNMTIFSKLTASSARGCQASPQMATGEHPLTSAANSPVQTTMLRRLNRGGREGFLAFPRQPAPATIPGSSQQL
eukprot:TRINITY_DN73873_c0_g1_i1.p1 TRINITY_DN73873_c0_g1~~TRINITY_DN73873_c0_g1_i1.p1  ORF type:complete len:122 (+),score=16.70 TRINITY_DN73873_c0_g1_i1:55-420(+)